MSIRKTETKPQIGDLYRLDISDGVISYPILNWSSGEVICTDQRIVIDPGQLITVIGFRWESGNHETRYYAVLTGGRNHGTVIEIRESEFNMQRTEFPHFMITKIACALPQFRNA